MATLQTTTCSLHGHAEFRLTFDPAIVHVEADVRWLISWLEQSVADGKGFAVGQTCQVGWMVTQVRLAENGSLSLCEPDMKAIPVVWAESVSNTLAQLRVQKDIVESVLSPSDLSFPSMRQSAIICTRLGKTEDMIMERSESTATDSGWFCGCRGDDHDHNNVKELKCVSLYEAAFHYMPQIVPYLALPSGVLIGVSGGVPTIFQNGDELAFKPGSLLAAHHQSC